MYDTGLRRGCTIDGCIVHIFEELGLATGGFALWAIARSWLFFVFF
jgi:hypothetical protein